MSSIAHDRRRARRRDRFEDHGVLAIRIRPGHAARVVDVSAGGALIETTCRLLPGTSVELHMETRSHHANVRGRVLRCDVARVRPTAISYRGAIRFDRSLPWFVDADGYHVPTADQRRSEPFRAEATPEVV